MEILNWLVNQGHNALTMEGVAWFARPQDSKCIRMVETNSGYVMTYHASLEDPHSSGHVLLTDRRAVADLLDEFKSGEKVYA